MLTINVFSIVIVIFVVLKKWMALHSVLLFMANNSFNIKWSFKVCVFGYCLKGLCKNA